MVDPSIEARSTDEPSGDGRRGRWRRAAVWVAAAALGAVVVVGLVWLVVQPIVVGGDTIEGRPARSPRLRRRRRGTGGLATRSWSGAARSEAEAVMAFEELAWELRAVGAPAELVEGALAAADDERRHVVVCRVLARSAGEPPVPTPVPAVGRLPRSCRSTFERRMRIARLGLESRLDGEINEGREAARLEALAAQCPPATAGMVAAIAVDERRHAELGRSVARWAQREGGGVARLVSRAADLGGSRG